METLNSKVVNLDSIETTATLWGIIDDKNPLIGKSILFEISSDDEDGTYPLVMHYVTLVKKIDSDGVSEWLNRVAGKNKLDFKFYDGLRIVRDSKWTDEAKIIFENPIDIVIETIGEKAVIIQASEFEGRFEVEWFFTRNGRQKNYANGFDITFKINKILK